jgi:phosphohistidine phosphatase
MTLYLLRHGIAVDLGARGFIDDRERPLTSEGKRKMKRVASGMKTLGVEFDLLLSSPYIRARQTAEIVATVLRTKKRLRYSDHLASDGDPAELIRHLKRDHRAARSIMLVGHEPYLSRLASLLVSGQPDLPLTLKKGGLCKLALERLRHGQCATLEWLLAPRILEAL